MNFKHTVIAAALLAMAGAHAAVTPEEAKQLGATLTAVGAEKAANKDGTIPEYSGGLTALPAGFIKGGGYRPDPYAGEKPRMTITGKNLAGMEDKLTAGTRELLKRYPNFRVDVYPTHRPVALPKAQLDNTAKNAVATKSTDGGVGVESLLSGVPFPIPKTGNEVMWNHLLRYQGHAFTTKYESWNVDSSGTPSLATAGEIFEEFPLADPKNTEMAKQNDVFFRTKLTYLAPARRAGEGLMTPSTRRCSRARCGNTCRASAASSWRRTWPTTRRTRVQRAPPLTTTPGSSMARWTATTSSWSARRR
jgi:hypothetical protein